MAGATIAEAAPVVEDRRLLHASALALASVAFDWRRNAMGLRTATRSHLAWLLAQRVLGATAVVQTSQFISSAALRGYHRRSDTAITRGEWGAAASTGLATVLGGAYSVHKMGGRPVLCAGFLLMPSLYAALATRESLVLLRSSQPNLYEAGLVASSGLLPLVILPPSLRLLIGLPIALPPLCAAWLEEREGVAAAIKERAANDDMRAATVLYHAPGAATLLSYQAAVASVAADQPIDV